MEARALMYGTRSQACISGGGNRLVREALVG